jgi:hypothetical protein
VEWIAVIALVAIVLGGLAAHRLLRWLDRWKRITRARIALRGETRARHLLERAGFIVEGEQVTHEYRYQCDGREERAGLRADFVVRRGNRRYVAEVKTGKLVTSLSHAPTRRQLLEYQCAFETDGVLLIDVAARRIRHVQF